ncbi:GGDEF domain-containing protein, partial [Comamonas sp.]|uniref:GGDEF domain-containing protein n=1 Tax=Comamonas sp. TaxID=34028 RepID=UPI00289DF16E
TCTPYTRGFNVLVLCDLDHFKCINDQYGHAVGDDVLRQFGHILQTVVREADVTARLGGEEFVLEFKHTSIEHAKKLIERIQAQMVRTHWSVQAPQLQVTASFGMVLLQAQEHLEKSLERADALMYLAKKAGRNCLRVEGESSLKPNDGFAAA